jgi:uncharacterized membrane protein YidH (DUF202 family)
MGDKGDALPWLVAGIILCLVGILIIASAIMESQYCQSLVNKGEIPEGCSTQIHVNPTAYIIIVVAIPFLVQAYYVYSRRD